MILNETVAAIADAIREKTGKSELIKPIDFAEEIKGITAGGGDAPSGDWRYFDRTIKTPTNEVGAMIGLFTLFKQDHGGQKAIMPVSYMAILDNQFYTNASALAIDLNMPFVMQGAPFTTVGEFINAQMQTIENMANGWNWTEITKEQFYDLNA